MKLHPSIEPLESRIAPAVIFTVETSTNKLVSFDSATPGTLSADVTITGLQANEFIAAIDFRPATGELYGLGLVDGGATRTGRLYTIDPTTAVATLVGAGSFSTTLGDTDRYGFDFNPTVDRIRLTNALDANFRLNPDTGAIVGVDGDISDGTATEEIVNGIAYDRNFGSNLTTLYGYDYQTDSLVTVGGLNSNPSPNSGLLTTVARAKLGGVNFSSSSSQLGFDIGGDFGGADVGWLGVDKVGQAGAHLYNVDLATAALTDLGQIGGSARLFGGLAVQLDGLAPVISTDGKTATWRDLDGDNVTLKITKGTLTAANFRMRAGDTGSALAQLTLKDASFDGTNVTLTAKPGPTGGDGSVNIGNIDAAGYHLGSVSVPGDIAAFTIGENAVNTAPAFKSLTVRSLGALGYGLIPSGNFLPSSNINAGAGKMTVAGDLAGDLFINGKTLASLTIGGNLRGGDTSYSGAIRGGNLGKAVIKGSILGSSGNNSGSIQNAGIGSLFIGGSILGGAGSTSGFIFANQAAKGLVTVVHDVIGSDGSSSGVIAVKLPATVKIGGDVRGGAGNDSGSISGVFSGPDTVLNVTIGGNFIGGSGGSYIDSPRLGTIAIKGSVLGSEADPVFIVATGTGSNPTPAQTLAIGKLTIGGDMIHARIGAGINRINFPSTADVTIGAIKIGRDMIASSITAGVDDVNDIVGDGDDKLITNVNTAPIIAKIASITIGGQLLGTVGGAPDTFGILAEQIGALTIGKVKAPLTAGKDDLTLGFTGDVRVREL